MSSSVGPTARATLTVCTIVHNEERRLPAALASVADIADEIVVVDSGSSDHTVEIATAAGARVIEHGWPGFARQRNVALDAARGDWVLELDADERVTAQLAAEINAFLALPPPPEVRIGLLPMRHHYLGRVLGPAGRYPFYRPRLVRRGAYRHDESRPVHERLEPLEAPWVFAADLEHELAGDLVEAVSDTWTYAQLSARLIDSVTGRDLVVGVIGRPIVKFLFAALVLGGIRDGLAGLSRIALECAGDASTWIFARRRGSTRRRQRSGHFGRRSDARGPAHLLAIGDPRPHWPWLRAAVDAGALVSLVCAEAHARPRLTGGERLRVRTTSGGPAELLRMADAEAQICPVTARVALDRAGALILRLVPGAAGEIIDPRRTSVTEAVF
jgi:(heptosyl)LPS beta-1,4-glucosyltransferase